MSVRVRSWGIGENVGGCASGNSGKGLGGGLILEFLGATILLDCGINVASLQIPDFGTLGSNIDCILISDFRLDRCGALPVITEKFKYSGPIYMSYPTKKLGIALLEEYSTSCMDRRDSISLYLPRDVENCFNKSTCINLNEKIVLNDKAIIITAGYSGHVIGGTYFTISSEHHSFTYISGFNCYSSKLCRPIQFQSTSPTALITNACFTTIVNKNRITIEKELLEHIYFTLEKGGKVFIPLFSIGQVVEILLTLSQDLPFLENIPIYCSEEIQQNFNMMTSFSSTWIKKPKILPNFSSFRKIPESLSSLTLSNSSSIILTFPGILTRGITFDILKLIAPNKNNLLILSEYCIQGTMNYDLIKDFHKSDIEKKLGNSIFCSIYYIPPSGDIDARNLLHLITLCRPSRLLIGYSDKSNLKFIQKLTKDLIGNSIYGFSRKTSVKLQLQREIPILLSKSLLPLKRPRSPSSSSISKSSISLSSSSDVVLDMSSSVFDIDAVLFVEQEKPLVVIPTEEAAERLKLNSHYLTFSMSLEKKSNHVKKIKKKSSALSFLLSDSTTHEDIQEQDDLPLQLYSSTSMTTLFLTLQRWLPDLQVLYSEEKIIIRSVTISSLNLQKLSLTWSYEDEDLALRVANLCHRLIENLGQEK